MNKIKRWTPHQLIDIWLWSKPHILYPERNYMEWQDFFKEQGWKN